MSSTSTMRSRGGLTSMASVDSMRSEPFSGRHPRLSMRQRSMEDIPEGPSKQPFPENFTIVVIDWAHSMGP